MILLYDILIYVFFAYFASMLARKSQRYIETRHLSVDTWDQYLICYMLFFAIIGGIRWNVGVDNISYITSAVYPNTISDSAEPLYRTITTFLHDIRLHWSIGLSLWCFIQIFFLTLALKQYRYLLVLLPYIMFGGRYWMDAMNVMRQMMVAFAFLWASKFIYEKKIIKYLLFIFIASFMHKSVLMLLPIYFLPRNLNIYKHRIILIAILIFCLIIGLSPAFTKLSYYVEILQLALGYDNYGNGRITNILNNGDTNPLSFGPMMLTYLLIPIFIIWFSPKIIKRYGDRIPYINLWYNFSFIYASIYFLVCNISEIFLRPITYFLPFQMVMATFVLYFLLHEIKYKKYLLETGIYIITIFTNTGWNVIKASGLPSLEETVTYKVFFMHERELKQLKL